MADHLAEELDDAYFDQLEEDLERIMNSEDDPDAEEVLRERALEEQAEQCMPQDSDGHWRERARSPISQRTPSLTRSEMDGILGSVADMSQGGGGAGCDSVVIFQRLIDDLLMILNGQLATEIEELVAFREHGKDVEELQLVGTMRETWGHVRRDVTTMLRLGQDLHQRSTCSKGYQAFNFPLLSLIHISEPTRPY